MTDCLHPRWMRKGNAKGNCHGEHWSTETKVLTLEDGQERCYLVAGKWLQTRDQGGTFEWPKDLSLKPHPSEKQCWMKRQPLTVFRLQVDLRFVERGRVQEGFWRVIESQIYAQHERQSLIQRETNIMSLRIIPTKTILWDEDMVRGPKNGVPRRNIYRLGMWSIQPRPGRRPT